MREKVRTEQMKNDALCSEIEMMAIATEMIKKLSPKLDQEKQEFARQSLMDEIVQLAQLVEDCALEVSRLPSTDATSPARVVPERSLRERIGAAAREREQAKQHV